MLFERSKHNYGIWGWFYIYLEAKGRNGEVYYRRDNRLDRYIDRFIIWLECWQARLRCLRRKEQARGIGRSRGRPC